MEHGETTTRSTKEISKNRQAKRDERKKIKNYDVELGLTEKRYSKTTVKTDYSSKEGTKT